MSEQKFATTLDDAYFNFEIGEPLPAGSPFYVRRQDKVVSKLKRILLRAKGKASVPRYLFSGHTGSGKSTELQKIADASDINDAYWPVLISLRKHADINDIDYTDVFFVIASQLFIAYKETGNLKKHDQLLEDIERWEGTFIKEVVIQEGDHTTKEFNAAIKAGIVELTSKFKKEPRAKEIIRKRVELHIGALVDNINELGTIILAHEGKRPLIIIDDLDKASLADSREIFISRQSTIMDINLPVIYAISSTLFYDPAFPSRKGIQEIFLPNIKLHEECSDVRVSEGYMLLRNFVHARMEPELISEDALELAMKMSGGVFRELVRIMQDSIDYALGEERERVEIEDVEQSVTDIRNVYWRILTQTHIDILDDIRACIPTRNDTETMAALLKMLAILEYNGSGRWFDVHPALYKLLDEFKREAERRQSRAS